MVEAEVYMKTSPRIYCGEKDTPVYETSRDGESESSSETRKKRLQYIPPTQLWGTASLYHRPGNQGLEGMVIAAEGKRERAIQLVRSSNGACMESEANKGGSPITAANTKGQTIRYY